MRDVRWPMVGLAGILVTGAGTALWFPPPPDVAWPLYLAGRMLDGARLAVDFQEINPPLYVWLAVPAAWLQRLTGLDPWTGNVLVLFLAIAGSLVLSRRLLRGAPPLAGTGRADVGLMFIGLVLALLPYPSYGQREHLAVVLTLPYVLLAGVASPPGRGVRVLVGLLGGVGFALKPFFLVPWILVEAWRARGAGWRSVVRPEAIALGTTGGAYLVTVILVAPEYFALLRTWSGTYATYLNNTAFYAMFPMVAALLPLVAGGVLVAGRLQGRSTPIVTALVLAGLGFWVAAAIQGKGLYYHHQAGIAYGALGVAFMGLDPGLRPNRRPSGWLVILARGLVGGIPTIVTALVLIGVTGLRKNPLFDGALPQLLPVVRALEGDRLVVFSSDPASAWPLTLEGRAEWGLRFMSLWPMAGFYHHELWTVGGVVKFRPLAARTGAERVFHEAVMDDLTRHPPRLLIVMRVNPDVWGAGGSARLDYLRYFGEDPRFREFLAGYRDAGPVGKYQLYRRVDPPGR